ncbi:hypothetical protein E0Z10_g4091 [Xylaria hypoxylon]|uniref:Septin-type G domain-containing protein n=1 Tax=Xylaria hypoxylon TaxID=37992 RepID=A0A4Z0YXG7_9PEZI|nr:hypothetical protein E0Z10_g4091 [Xylaria hypoxylon]
MLGPSCVGSAGSSSSSRRNSFTSSLSDHPVSYDQESAGEPVSTSSMLGSGSAPQLVMPSIMMPSRRPFTETGQHLGRLKILLAGDSGMLLDYLWLPTLLTLHLLQALQGFLTTRHRVVKKRVTVNNYHSEIHASTKPYPEWWQDLDTPGAPHKRKRLGDQVLERNICFVDTPGYSRGSSAMETIMSCVDYIESHLSKVLSDDISDVDLINMLGGSGGYQVDAVLYLISHTLKPADLEYMRRLTPLTNVIPILTRAEMLSDKQTATRKQEIAGQLESAGIRPFTFTPTAAQEKGEPSAPSAPYTASSATVSDHDIMDASLLMSADYIQPLIPTDLAFLVEKIFSLDGASWLRHSAAKKYLQWRELTPRQPRDLYRPLTPPAPVSHYPPALWRQQSLPLVRRPDPQQGSGTAQVQMADWVAELQRGFASERLRYETLTRRERAVWLVERLHECAQEGTLAVVNGPREASSGGRRGVRSGRHVKSRTQRHQDPLGLLQVAADLKARGWMAVEVLGSLGMVGLALWISRHGWPTQAVQLIDEWMRF